MFTYDLPVYDINIKLCIDDSICALKSMESAIKRL